MHKIADAIAGILERIISECCSPQPVSACCIPAFPCAVQGGYRHIPLVQQRIGPCANAVCYIETGFLTSRRFKSKKI